MFRTQVHGPELRDAKQPPTAPHPLLPEQDGTTRIELHEQGYDPEQGREQHQPDCCPRDIHRPLDRQLPALEAGSRELDERLVVAPEQVRLDAGDLGHPRHRQQTTPGRERSIHHLGQTRLQQVPANDDGFGREVIQQRREVVNVADRVRRRRQLHIHEPDGDVLAPAGEGATRRDGAAVLRRTDKERLRRVPGGRDHARHDLVDGLPLGQQPQPHQNGRQRVLQQHDLEPPRPNRHPQRQGGCQRARKEQPPRIPALIPLPVVAENQQPHEQGRGELPTVQDAGRHYPTHRASEPLAQHGVVPHRPHQLPHDPE